MMTELDQAIESQTSDDRSFLAKLLAGDYGLAVTYWALYFVGAAVFFFTGSAAVDEESWLTFLLILALVFAYTLLLVIGIRAAYQGPQLWKVVSRTSSIFMIINILVGICTLGFIY